MRTLLLTIELLQPLLATGLDGEPNSAATQPYIPGSLLRGAAIARCLAAAGKPDLDDLAEPERALTWNRFFTDRIRFLNGYPAVTQTSRALPVPLHWKRKKHSNSTQVHEAETEFKLGHALATLPRDYFTPRFGHGGKAIDLLAVEEHMRVHMAANADYGYAVGAGVSSGNPGAIFRYIALAAGQFFLAPVLLCAASEDEQKDDEEWLKKLLAGNLRLGRARTAYGEVRISAVVVDGWSEVPEEAAPIPGSFDSFRITLLSDALIRNQQGQYLACLDPAELAASLGQNSGDLMIGPVAAATTIAGGFNRKWNLPLPQTPAIAAGSSFDVLSENPVTATQLQGLIDRGLGERRNEGFGRVAVNLTIPEEFGTVGRYQPRSASAEAAAVIRTPEQQSILDLIGARLCQPAIEAAIEQHAAHLWLSAGPKPSRSALSRLIAAAQHALELAEAPPAPQPLPAPANQPLQPQPEPGQSAPCAFWKQALDAAHGPFRAQIESAQMQGPEGKQESLFAWLSRFSQPECFEKLNMADKADFARLTQADIQPALNRDALQFRFLIRALGLLRRRVQREEAQLESREAT